MCQHMPRELYKRFEFKADLERLKPHQHKSRIFENLVMSYFQRMTTDYKFERFCSTGTEKLINFSNEDWFWGCCDAVFEARNCLNYFCLPREARPSLPETDIQRGAKSRRSMKCGNNIWGRKVLLLSKSGNVNGVNCTILMRQ